MDSDRDTIKSLPGDSEYISRNYRKLHGEHGSVWIAVYDEQVRGKGLSMWEAIDDAEENFPDTTAEQYSLACLLLPVIHLFLF